MVNYLSTNSQHKTLNNFTSIHVGSVREQIKAVGHHCAEGLNSPGTRFSGTFEIYTLM